jgi:hypothetical protein
VDLGRRIKSQYSLTRLLLTFFECRDCRQSPSLNRRPAAFPVFHLLQRFLQPSNLRSMGDRWRLSASSPSNRRPRRRSTARLPVASARYPHESNQYAWTNRSQCARCGAASGPLVYAYRGVRPRASRTLHLGRLRFPVNVDRFSLAVAATEGWITRASVIDAAPSSDQVSHPS